MPRYGPFIHQVYVADGFADDCDELIHRCLKAENFDYHVFCQIWKNMNMGCMYEGRTLGAEIAELSEEVLQIGKHYMLKDTSNFEESAIGVFIMYALLHLQPYKGFAHLRLVPEDLPAINRIEYVARRDKRYDVLYALGSILIKGPVQYHAAEREYGMDLAVRKYLEGFTSIDKLGVRPKGVFRRQNVELDILKELDIIIQKYSKGKMMISDKAQFDRNLKYVDADIPNLLENLLRKLISGIHEEKYGTVVTYDDGEKIMNSRRAIKERALKEDVKPVKHLINLKDRKTSNDNSPNKEESKTSSKKKTRKSKSKKDSTVAKAERKRRIPISPRALKKNCNKIKFKIDKESTSENDESDVIVNVPSENSDDNLKLIALLDKTQVSTIDTKKKRKGKKTVVKNEEVNEQELDIEIDTLPVLIRTENQGKLFEIEIIDKKHPAKKSLVKTYKKKESALKKISSMPGMSIEKIVEPETIEPLPSTSSVDPCAVIIEVGKENDKGKGEVEKTAQDAQAQLIPNPKVEKRDCKRVHIQSKFKRLGMLPIANFKVTDASEETDENSTTEEPQKELGLEPIEDL